MSFPEDLDDSFHQGLLSDDESGFENTISDVPKKRNQKGNQEQSYPVNPAVCHILIFISCLYFSVYLNSRQLLLLTGSPI